MASVPFEASSPVDVVSLNEMSPRYLPEPSRVQSLDVIKGIALMFGLFISIYVWGGLTDGMQYKLVGNPKGYRHIVYVLMSFFLEGKMMGLICLAFGAGMILFMVRPHERLNISNAEMLIRKNMWLMGFGLLNAFVLLWPRDILFHLGILGLLLFPFVRMNIRLLLTAVFLVMLIGAGKNYWYFADDQKAYKKYLVVQSLEKKFSKDSADRMKTKDSSLFKKHVAGPVGKEDSIHNKKISDSLAKKAGDTLTRKQNDEKQNWEGIAKKFTYDGKKDSASRKALQVTSYGKIWSTLLPQVKSRESGWFYRNGIWEMAALMLMGMYLFKLGFFNGRFNQRQYFWMAVTGVLLGLLCGWYRLHFLNVSVADYTAFVKTRTTPHTFLFPFERVFMVFGIGAKIVWFTHSNILKKLRDALADTGRLALTNYLLQSLFLSIFFYGYGMGYYGRIGQIRLYFLVVEVCLVQIVFSVMWMRYFNTGPVEWLLRSLVYKKKIPFSRKTENAGQRNEQKLNIVL